MTYLIGKLQDKKKKKKNVLFFLINMSSGWIYSDNKKIFIGIKGKFVYRYILDNKRTKDG
jgi:hypothetical protein